MSRALRPWLVSAALAALIALVYLPVLDHGFVDYDDNLAVTGNPIVLGGLSTDGVAWAFTTFHASNWQPLTWISHMADVTVFGPSARGPHLVNVLLHVANTVLLLALLARLTGAFWKSAIAALLFALHPLHVESVAWVSERKDLLSTCLWFLTMHAYARYAAMPTLARRVPVLLAFAAGLMAKPMLVTVPAVLLLLDFWPLGRWRRRDPDGESRGWGVGKPLLLEKAPLFALAAASAAVTIVAQSAGGAVKTLQQYPLVVRAANALVSAIVYLRRTLWPAGLQALYPYDRPAILQGIVAGAVLLLVTTLAIRAWRRRPWLATGWLWYLGTLLPVIGLVQVGDQPMADRYTYVTLVGIFVVLAWGGEELAQRGRWNRVAAVSLVLALVPTLAVLSRVQAGYWKDNLALFGRSVQLGGDNPIAHNNYGGALLQAGQPAAATGHFRAAIAGFPGYAAAHLNLGLALLQLGGNREAVNEFQKAVALNPDDRNAWAMLGRALASAGDLPGALAVCSRLAALDSDGARRLLEVIDVARKAGASTP